MKVFRIVAYVSTLCGIWGQTQVDLRTQAKSAVDFSQSTETKPVRSGTVLPATCAIAEMFFKTNATAGQNLFACVATNVWTLIGGTSDPSALLPPLTGNAGRLLTTDGANASWSLVPPGSVAVRNGASVVGTRPAMEFVAGMGLLTAVTDTGSQVRIQHTVDTSVMETVQAHQSGATLLCASASGSGSAYTCSLSPALASYAAGMRVHWLPDVAGGGRGHDFRCGPSGRKTGDDGVRDERSNELRYPGRCSVRSLV